MADKILNVTLIVSAVILILLLILAVFIIASEIAGIVSEKYFYECTDIQGNLIYCTYAYTSKSGMYGVMEDGTYIAITSYKRLDKEGADIDE